MLFRRRSAAALAGLLGVRRFQLFVQSSLALGEPLRHMNLKPDVKVAAWASALDPCRDARMRPFAFRPQEPIANLREAPLALSLR